MDCCIFALNRLPIIRNYIIRNYISKLSICVFVFLLQLFQPPLQVSILVLQSRFITSFNAQSLCSFALSAPSLPLSLPAEGIALCASSSASVSAKTSAIESAKASATCSGIVSSPCSPPPPSSSLSEGYLSLRAALCPVASLTNLQQKKSMIKIWPPPAATVGMVYISASRCITSRRVNVYKETVGSFGRIQGYITLKYDIYPVISLRSRGPSSSSDLEKNTRT